MLANTLYVNSAEILNDRKGCLNLDLQDYGIYKIHFIEKQLFEHPVNSIIL